MRQPLSILEAQTKVLSQQMHVASMGNCAYSLYILIELCYLCGSQKGLEECFYFVSQHQIPAFVKHR